MKISVLQNSLFLALLAVTISAAAPDSTVLAHRMQISVRLDSLEFEKQECKRQGRPLDALETRCRALRDSLDLFRASASGASFSPAETASAKTQQNTKSTAVTQKSSFSFQSIIDMIPTSIRSKMGGIINPQSPFDWIMLLVSLIATLSGMVLLFGMISMIKDKIGPKKRKGARGLPPPPQRAALAAPKQSASSVAMLQKLKDTSPAKPEPKAAPTLPPEPKHSQDETAMEILRSKMRSDETSKPASTEPAQSNNSTPPITGATLRERVLSANKIGQSPEEIAKNLHVSLDQVKLILRVAGLAG